MTFIIEGPSLACHCEEPDRATWQSPIKKRGDCFAPLAMTLWGGLRCMEMVLVIEMALSQETSYGFLVEFILSETEGPLDGSLEMTAQCEYP